MKSIFGIDFSGAKDAGNKIWITSGIVFKKTLYIRECYPAKDLPDSDKSLDSSLKAIRKFIVSQEKCAFGFDFPFGLPLKLVKSDSWEEFLLSFSQRFTEPESFREICWREAGYRELKRHTDLISHVPFSPYNRRLFKQTYYGIREVLAPLVAEKLVSVLPMQKQSSNKPLLLEVCPASTLKMMGLYQSYKSTNKNLHRRKAREYIVQEIEETGLIKFENKLLKEKIVDNPGGDAMDSLIAALATFKSVSNVNNNRLNMNTKYLAEGHIYI